MWRKSLWWHLSLVVLAMCQSGSPSDPPTKFVIATGPPSGYYQQVCLAMSDVGRSNGLDIGCESTNGSQANVYRLDSQSEQNHDADVPEFAMVQSDVAHRAWKGELPFNEPHEKTIRLVTPLFTEKVHILMRPHQYLTSIGQLRNRRIWLGAENSGSRFSAEVILRAAGLDSTDLHNVVTSLDSTKALTLLRTEDDAPGKLIAVVDHMPDQVTLTRQLDSLGIKKIAVPPSGSIPSFNVLLAPDVNANDVRDLRGRAVQIPENCCKRQAAQLSRLGIVLISDGHDMVQALDRLRSKEIGALIQPEPLEMDMACAIMQSQGLVVSPLAPDPKTDVKENLMIFLRRGSTLRSAVERVIDRRMKIWWADHDLDEVVLRSLVPDGSVNGIAARRETLRRASRGVTTAMAFDLLSAGELDAVFQTTTAPNTKIRKLANSTEIGFLGIDWPLVEKLNGDGSYIETSLQRRAYDQLESGIFTVGVQTLLLTRLGAQGEEGRKVQILATFLRDRLDAIQTRLKDPNDPEAPAALTLIGAPLREPLKPFVHDSARDMLVMGHLRPSTVLQLSSFGGGLLVVGLVGLLMLRSHKLCADHVDKILMVLFCGLYWMIAATWLQAVEGDISQDFASLSAAAITLGKTVLANLHLPTDPPEPTTHEGRLMMPIFSWIGVLLVGGFVVPYFKLLWKNNFRPTLERWQSSQYIMVWEPRGWLVFRKLEKVWLDVCSLLQNVLVRLFVRLARS